MGLIGALLAAALPAPPACLHGAAAIRRQAPSDVPANAVKQMTLLPEETDYGFFPLTDRAVLQFSLEQRDIGALRAYRVDLPSGAMHPLTGLNAHLERDAESIIFLRDRGAVEDHCQVSPDGRWLLIADHRMTPGPICRHLLRLDGTHRHIWRVKRIPDRIVWLPDSTGWLEDGTSEPGLWLRTVKNPARSRLLVRAPQASGLLIGCLPDRSLVTMSFAGTPPRPAFTRIAARPHAAPEVLVRLTDESAPQGNDVAFSSRTRRFAWLAPAICPVGAPVRLSLWVCDFHGGKHRELGRFPGGAVWNLRFLPSGQGVSFVCNGALWTIPVE